MQPLRQWSFGKVLRISAAWFVFSLFLLVGWVFFQASRFVVDSSGGGGTAAVWFAVSDVLLAIPIVPPMVLIGVWLVARRLKSA